MLTHKSLVLILGASLTLGACANKGPRGPERNRPDMDPEARTERMEHIYKQFVSRWDYNEDGMASCDDIKTQRSRLFKQLDDDKDGTLTSGEYKYAKFEDKSFMFFDFLRVDKNASGVIELDELTEVPHSQFLHADKDGNCTISPPEAMAIVRETMMGSGDERRARGGKGGRAGKPPELRNKGLYRPTACSVSSSALVQK